MWIRASLLLFLTLLSAAIEAAEIGCASPSKADIETALSTAIDGDTIWVTNGTASYTASLTINKAVTLRCTGTNCVIVDSMVDVSGAAVEVWKIYQLTNGVTKVYGFTFKDGAVGSRGNNGLIQVMGTNTPATRGWVVFQNNAFLNVDNQCLFWYGGWGVVHSNYFQLKAGTYIANYIYQDVSGSAMSDFYWSTNTSGLAGLDVGVVMETNVFDRPDNYAIVDAYFGAVYTVRHNTIIKGWAEAHGTDSGGRRRGTRWMEVYGNTYVSNTYIANIRSGSGVMFNNTNYGYATPLISLDAYRKHYPFSPFGTANGTNAWDSNLAGGPFATGNATSVGTLTVTDSTKSWTPSEWVGYSIIKSNGGSSYWSSYITANTSTQITFHNAGGFDTNLAFFAGNNFFIYKVTEAFDQPGRCCGTLLSGDPPTVVPNDQIDDPLYEWNNTVDGAAEVDFTTATVFIRTGEHFYSDTERPGYAALSYPHPLISVGGYGIRAVVSGRPEISGRASIQ